MPMAKRIMLFEYGLKANKEKCEFFNDSVTYCGHTIDKDGLHKNHKEKLKLSLKHLRTTKHLTIMLLSGDDQLLP